jgi:hypothetical protein
MKITKELSKIHNSFVDELISIKINSPHFGLNLDLHPFPEVE